MVLHAFHLVMKCTFLNGWQALWCKHEHPRIASLSPAIISIYPVRDDIISLAAMDMMMAISMINTITGRIYDCITDRNAQCCNGTHTLCVF